MAKCVPPMPCYDNNVIVYTTYPAGCASTSGGPFTLPLPSDDVYYSGPALPNSGIETNDILTEVLQKLDYIYSVGTSGTSGIAGTSGTSGLEGTSGSSGTSGSGTSGEAGTSGSSGLTGTSGTSGSGTSGTDGTSGTNGTSGLAGTSGTSSTVEAWQNDSAIVYATDWDSPTTELNYRKWEGMLMLRGYLEKSGGNFNSGDIVFTLPVGYRPTAVRRVMVGPQDVNGGLVLINISISGTVEVWENGVTFGNPTTYDTFWIDGVFVSL